MFDQSFNVRTLANQLRKSDFFRYKEIRNEELKIENVRKSCELAKTLLKGYQLNFNNVRGKMIFSMSSLVDELVFRKLNSNLLYCFKIKYGNRSDIIDNIKNIMSEGNSYTIYRLDVSSFYESFDIETVRKNVDLEFTLSSETKKMLFSFLDGHVASGHTGLPRGIATSAILSEFMMRGLDSFLKRKKGVFYHSRFVDDIFIVTSGEETEKEFLEDVQHNLPKGLLLNHKKGCVKKLSSAVMPYKGDKPAPIAEVEYLGYKFIVHEPPHDKRVKLNFRDVQLDISESKVKKIKTRIVLAFKDFNDNSKDFNLLESRLRFLTSNFSVLDSNRDRKRLSGIFHNYHMVQSERSEALVELDLFLRKAILSSHGAVFEKIHLSLTQAQKYRLLKVSFKRGFEKCHYSYFRSDKLKSIQECWKYA